MPYISIDRSVGDTVHFHDSEEDCARRGVIKSIVVTQSERFGDYHIIYRVGLLKKSAVVYNMSGDQLHSYADGAWPKEPEPAAETPAAG